MGKSYQPTPQIADELKEVIKRHYPDLSNTGTSITYSNDSFGLRAEVAFYFEKNSLVAVFEYAQRGIDNFWRCASDWES